MIFFFASFRLVSELQEEGKHAIESPTSPTVPDIGPEGYQLGRHRSVSKFNTILVVA